MLILGIQSFGGGTSTFYLIHQACIQRGWLDEQEFVRTWALAQIAPGINLLKLTVMLGYRLRGWPGLVAAVAGLLVPSAAVTVLMTAGFATIRSVPLVQAIMKGILPATIGLSLAMGAQMAQPLFTRARHEGSARLGAHFLILLGAAFIMAFTHVSPVFILLLAGVATVVVLAVIPVKNGKPAEQGVR
jgi:chromate transporter